MAYVVGLVLLGVGLLIGERLPDTDQSIGLLRHRSIVTHSPLIPLLLFLVAKNSDTIPLRWFLLGVSLGFAVHLGFDLFPRGWQGYALISVPFYGSTPPWFSIAWIAGSLLSCAYLAARLTRGYLEAVLYLASLAGVFIYANEGEHKLIQPAIAIAATAFLSLSLRRGYWRQRREQALS